MVFSRAALVSSLAATTAVAQSTETIVGVYIFSRHGDRTPKALPPANLTDLGYAQVYQRGQYYNSRYIAADASNKIDHINPELVRLAQLSVSAPVDNVLQNSAAGFLQGLYPPVGSTLGTQTLANGSSVAAPFNGFQLIPINTIATGAGSEDSGWLQDASSCANAETSSNNYFSSTDYMSRLNTTHDFYQSLNPVVNSTFNASSNTFKNAYTVFDYLNVAEIHNATIPSGDLLTNATNLQLRTLANAHEFGLAYNASDDARAVSGMQLAGEILTYLNNTIQPANYKKHNSKLGIQFGAYATALSFFGLSDLTAADERFYGVNGYASTAVFELFTTADVGNGTVPPAADDLSVRFLWHNGSDEANNNIVPTAYPLFGQNDTAIPWSSFVGNMSKFAVQTTEEWCNLCGNYTGTCAAYAPSGTASTTGSGNSGSHLSTAVGGVIGAMTTLGVFLLGAAALGLLGFRIHRKHKGTAVPEAKASTDLGRRVVSETPGGILDAHAYPGSERVVTHAGPAYGNGGAVQPVTGNEHVEVIQGEDPARNNAVGNSVVTEVRPA